MTIMIKIISILALASLLPAASAYAEDDPWKDCTEKIAIVPARGEPTFYFIPRSFNVEDQNGNIVNDLLSDAYDGDIPSPEAKIPERIAYGLTCKFPGKSFFRDVTFDGYKDISLSLATGILGNTVGWVWVYNPDKKIFEFSKQFANIIGAEVDVNPNKKLLMSYNECCAGKEQTVTVSRWDGDKIKMVRKCGFAVDENGKIDDNTPQCFHIFGKKTELEKSMRELHNGID
jgi:hypothetical protein